MPPRRSADASLGVFDKLTLCTLSVELSLSNTRSAALQLPVGVAEVFAGALAWANGEGKEGLLASEAFPVSKPHRYPAPVSLHNAFLWVRENHMSRCCLLLSKTSTILIQRLKLYGAENDVENSSLTFCRSYTAMLAA